MAYGNNDMEQAGAPKKADVLIRSTQHIALKQEELSEQTKLAISRIDEAIELFSKNSEDASYIVKQNGDIFSQLQGENSALKQELLYLAKQSENIYAGLAEKITELSDQAKTREDAMAGLADKINDVSEQARKSEEVYSGIIDRLTEIAEQNRRTESAFSALNEKLELISEHAIKNEKAYGELSDKIVVTDKAEPVEVDNSQVLEKINYISDQLRRSESAHSMLADKFEILSMRVEQFGFQSASKPQAGYTAAPVQPVAYPVPAQTTVVKEEIDYDKLAEKVASLISTREVISPDYIASKVAEQIVIPEVEAARVKVSVDSGEIAKQVAELIGANSVRNEEIAPASAVADIDEESLAERIAAKVGGIRQEVSMPVSSAPLDVDTDELADAIALKVGSLKAEDFDIIVDDEGCNSISKEIANHLDYEVISNIISDKLREALDLAAVNAPDYEEMAERISEKITVAGINEDAIADKAAAVLSNYLPEFDTDEITDKITGAVIDVVSAMPQPALDNEAICNAISERLIQSQEDHDYDIVIDDDGITKITDIVSEEIEKETGARFDKVEEEIAKISELVSGEPNEDISARFDKVEEEIAKISELVSGEPNEDISARFDKVEEEIAKISELVSGEPNEDISARFDKMEEEIAKISELVSGEPNEDISARFDKVEEEIAKISELVSGEPNEDISARFDKVEEDIAKLCDMLTEAEATATRTAVAEEAVTENRVVEEVLPAEEVKEVSVAEISGQDYVKITSLVAAEIQRGTSSRFDKVEEDIAKLTQIVSNVVAEVDNAEYEDEYVDEVDYATFSEVVSTEIEKGVSSRLDSLEQNIAKIAEFFEDDGEETSVEDGENVDENEEGEEESADYGEEDNGELDYSALSEVVAAEIEKGVAAVNSRLDSVEQNISKLTEYFEEDETGSEDGEEDYEEYDGEESVEFDYSALSEVVAAEIEKGVSSRLDGVEQNVAEIKQYITAEKLSAPAQETDAAVSEDAVHYESGTDNSALPALVATINENLNSRFDSVEQHIAEIKQTTDDINSNLADGASKEELYARLDSLDGNITKLDGTVHSAILYNTVTDKPAVEESYEEVPDYTAISNVVAEEIERGIAYRLDSVEENVLKLNEVIAGATDKEEINSRFDKVEENIAKISELVQGNPNEASDETNGRLSKIEQEITKISELVQGNPNEASDETNGRLSKIEEEIAKISNLVVSNPEDTNGVRFDKLEEEIAKLTEIIEEGGLNREDSRFNKVEDDVAQIKEMLASGAVVANTANEEVAVVAEPAVEPAVEPEEVEEPLEEPAKEEEEPVEEDEEELVTVSDLVEPEEVEEPAEEDADDEFGEEEDEDEEDEKDDDDDFLMNVLDMDAFSDDELMPGELSDFGGGVDFANMMKFKRSFIARIIQSNDDYKQYYGEVKHALLSYKKVNSNVAWSNERFNKGRETIARMKIRGKTLCLYLALDPNDYKTSVYHHLDVSYNKSVNGTPMMVKIKSNLGVRKAIRLIDEMLAKRNGEKKEIPERDYAAMYPYETIEELIEDGLVKDVRKK